MEIIEYLERYKDKEVIYIPNPGNAGDNLIATGTYNLFDRLGIKYKFGRYSYSYTNKYLIYGGGGNLVGTYKFAETFLKRNKDKNNDILLLPHTIYNVDDILESLGNNITLFCREKTSLEYVKSKFKYQNNIYIDHDMAFHLDKKYYDNNTINTNDYINAFRVDAEKTNISIPDDNYDISLDLMEKDFAVEKNKSCKVVDVFFKKLSEYKTINTNRTHVAIAGCLLNKNVNFYPNSYHKNKSIYEYSLMNRFEKINFINK